MGETARKISPDTIESNEIEPDDASLIEKIKNGDQQAFRVLHKKYNEKLMGFLIAKKMEINNETEEIIQNTWIKAYKFHRTWKRIMKYLKDKGFVKE